MVERQNSFDLVRLVAALLVLFGHSFPLAGQLPPVVMWRGIHVLGVEIFFAISGYLITLSLMRDRNLPRFLAKRALRILPGLWVCVLAMLAMGLAVTTLAKLDYAVSPVTADFLNNAILRIRYSLPGVFQTNIYPWAVNGSLWSIPVEVMLYLAFFVFLLLGRWGIIPAILVQLVLTGTAERDYIDVVWETPADQFVAISPLFLAGSAMALFPSLFRPNAILGSLALVALAIFPGLNIYYSVIIAYAVVSFGVLRNPIAGVTERIGDLSFGTYLYAFPVQQLVMLAAGNGIGPYRLAAFATPIVLALAWLSWRFVEHPALALKPRRPAQSDRPEN